MEAQRECHQLAAPACSPSSTRVKPGNSAFQMVVGVAYIGAAPRYFFSASIMCSKIENAFPKRIIHYSPLFRLMVPVIMFLASGVTAALRVLYKNLNLLLHCNLHLNLHLYLHLYLHLHQVTIISNYNKISVTVTKFFLKYLNTLDGVSSCPTLDFPNSKVLRPSSPCVFPFKYRGKTWTHCTFGGVWIGKRWNWCSTQVY